MSAKNHYNVNFGGFEFKERNFNFSFHYNLHGFKNLRVVIETLKQISQIHWSRKRGEENDQFTTDFSPRMGGKRTKKIQSTFRKRMTSSSFTPFLCAQARTACEWAAMTLLEVLYAFESAAKEIRRWMWVWKQISRSRLELLSNMVAKSYQWLLSTSDVSCLSWSVLYV